MSAPTITSINYPSSGRYVAGNTLTFQVNLSTYVDVTGSPQLGLNVGVSGGGYNTRYATLTYNGGSVLEFSYDVVLDDIENIGVHPTGWNMNGGTIKDYYSPYDDADLSLPEPMLGVLTGDITAPVVSSVYVPAAGTYSVSDGATYTLSFQVNFSEYVTVTGTPRLALTIGSTTRYANCTNTGYSSSHTFEYDVVLADIDTNGITVNSLGLNGGTIRDDYSNNANLTLNSVGSTTGVLVGDVTAPVVSSVSVPADGTYTYDLAESLSFTVYFNESVTVTGTPRLALTIGSTTRYANCTSTGYDSYHTFTYAIQQGDLDENGIAVNSLQLNGGTIRDFYSNNATLTLNNVGNTTGVLVDGGEGGDTTAPTVVSVTVPSNGTYKIDDNLNFTVYFDEAVTVTGTPRLTLMFGTTALGWTEKYADYLSGSGSSSVVFRYTVVNGDSDTDGISVSSLGLNSGTIQDAAYNNANLTLNSVGSTTSVLVDGIRPVVNSVTVPTTNTYKIDDNLNFTVIFNEAVAVTGTPRLALTIGSTTRYANYLSGTGSASIVFRHTVLEGDFDANGIAINSFGLNSGTLKDIAGNDATLTLNSVGSTTSVHVDGIRPVVTSVTVPSNGTYSTDDNLDFTVAFDEGVVVTGTPRISLTIGSTTRYANYLSGSGSTSIVFRHTVLSGDLDANGIAVNSLGLNSGTMKDAAGNNANLTLNSVGSTTSILVDAVGPVVSSVTVPTNGTYKIDNNLNFTVVFNEAVAVTGTPRLALTIGSTTRYANYLSGTGSTSIVFRHTVLEGDFDANGIAINSLGLNSGTLKDAAGNDATLTLNNVGSTTSVLVEGVRPSISSIAITQDNYTTDDEVDINVSWHENVTVVGSPRLNITVGETTRYANYVSGSGSSSLIFRHTVLSGDNDEDGIGINSIDLNSGTIRDSVGNDANLTLNNIGGYAVIDTAQSVVTSVSIPSNDTYCTDENLDFTVNWNETVIVTGTPRISLTIGSTTRYANYLSGSASSSLVFRHTVLSGDTDMNGIAVNSLGLNSGTIQDYAGNNAILTLNSVGSTTSVLVDTTSPVVSSVSVPNNATYTVGQNLNFTVIFDEAVAVTGTPRITLTIGSTTRYANYLSGTGTTSIVFRHTVVSGDVDANGITVGTLGLNSGTMKDAAGNDAILTLNSVGSTTSVLVDAAATEIGSVNVVAMQALKTQTVSSTNLAYDQNPAVATSSITYTIVTSTVYGKILLNGRTLEVDDTFTQEDIDDGNVVYVRSNFNATADYLTVGPVVGGTAAADVTINVELLIDPTISMKIISRLKRIIMG